jgi:ribosomal-protein-alanine N-acetyltransferase
MLQTEKEWDMEISLRLASTADAVPIALMSRRLVECGLPSWAWTPRRVIRQIRHQESVVLTARRQEDLIGFSIMYFSLDSAHLNLLAVEPAYRRLGVGREMVRWLEKSAMTAGTFDVSLEVRASNPGAVHFYRSLGYRETSRMLGYYERLEDAIRMSRDLRIVRIDQAL